MDWLNIHEIVPSAPRFVIKAENRNQHLLEKREGIDGSIKVEPIIGNDFQSPLIKQEPPRKLQLLANHSINKNEVNKTRTESITDGKRRKAMLRSLRKRELDNAVHIHKTLVTKDPASLTNRELDSLTWAESIIVRGTFRRNKNAIAKAVPRESRLGLSEPKLPGKATDLSTLQLAVVDFGKPGGRYSIERARRIEVALGKAVISHIRNNVSPIAPTYRAPSWYDGVTVLDCKDNDSYQFAKDAVDKMKLWKGAILRAIPPEKIPFMSIGRIHVPDLKIEKEEVLYLLRSQNPEIDMRNWKVIEEESSKDDSKIFTLLITEPPITLLQNKSIRLFYGSGEVILRLLGCDWPGEI